MKQAAAKAAKSIHDAERQRSTMYAEMVKKLPEPSVAARTAAATDVLKKGIDAKAAAMVEEKEKPAPGPKPPIETDEDVGEPPKKKSKAAAPGAPAPGAPAPPEETPGRRKRFGSSHRPLQRVR